MTRSETREATCIYQFIANNHAFFTCGERTVCTTIEKCQQIMGIIVGKTYINKLGFVNVIKIPCFTVKKNCCYTYIGQEKIWSVIIFAYVLNDLYLSNYRIMDVVKMKPI